MSNVIPNIYICIGISIWDTKLQTGWGVEDVDRHTVGVVGRGSSGRWLCQIVTYDGTGSPHYAGFNSCSEFFSVLLDWTTMTFEW